ncbi:MAG: glycosyltransferase family 4 protein [Terriglobales bacterium]
MRNVIIIQAMAKQYRLPFFEKLHAALLQDGVRLRVLYSGPNGHEAVKGDNVDLPPEFSRKVKAHWMFRGKVLYQEVLADVRNADLIVVEQANKHIINYLLLLLSSLNMKKVGFWGLGENKQADRTELSEWLKRRLLKRPDWWFAYTAGTAEYLVAHGVPRHKITAVQNSVDTSGFRRQLEAIGEAELFEARQRLGISDGARVGVFCGMLDRVKGLRLLLDSALRIREAAPNFHLLIAGGGQDRPLAENAAATYPWIHYLGPAFGAEKAMAFRLADVCLMPGRVGLAVLDAFAAGLPLITVDIPIHGPEMEYLEDGKNGLKLRPEAEAFARGVSELLSDPARLRTLQQGAVESGRKYSIEAMVERFRAGILSCLQTA